MVRQPDGNDRRSWSRRQGTLVVPSAVSPFLCNDVMMLPDPQNNAMHPGLPMSEFNRSGLKR